MTPTIYQTVAILGLVIILLSGVWGATERGHTAYGFPIVTGALGWLLVVVGLVGA